MLGTRGCRLGIIKPGLYRMQVRAIIEAAIERKLHGGDPRVEIMIPLVVSEPELALLAGWVRETAGAVDSDNYVGVEYLVGTMVDIALARRPLSDLRQLLTSTDNQSASPPAPPQGLYLEAVTYPPELYAEATS